MKDDYKLQGQTGKIEVELEVDVLESLKKMAENSKITASELANTAVKRFASQHKDFFPFNVKKTNQK